MLTELIAISGVFLISTLLPAVLGDPTMLNSAASPAGTGTAPLLLALAGGAGVGALIVMTGRSVWAALFAYRGTPVGRFLRGRDTSFHKRSAELYPGLRALAKTVTKSSATVDSLTTTIIWHGFADQKLLDFTRRRHGMFSENLNACTAIAFGLVCSQLLTGQWTWQRLVVTVALIALAGVSLASGWQARKKAEQVEELWHLLASRNRLTVGALLGAGDLSVSTAADGTGPSPKRGQPKPPS